MNHKLAIIVFFAGYIHMLVLGQSETYIVKKASFSTDKYDEFSPVIYKNGIVFCSNRSATRILSYSTEQNKSFLKINFIDTVSENPLQSTRFLSKNLNSKFNDGPVTFNNKGDTIYFSRNILNEGKLSELSSVRNKLGIFYAVFDGEDWTKIREMRINNEWYNVTTPWLSPDGKRLYFASDKPGGYGGSDIYYCRWKNDYWDDPVNVGPVINTKGNESYPFINGAGEFFFSSDGHPGLGGKDIFFSSFSDTSWAEPVCLDTPVNSQYDDFGIYTDTLMSEGYFSSNRDKTIDIFHFKTNFPQIFYTAPQKENNYCYVFNGKGAIIVDTTRLQYKWSFGDGETSVGSIVNHCYLGPGNYDLRLDIIELESGRQFFTKLIEKLLLRDFEQAYINSPDFGVRGEVISFDGLKSYLPGYKAISYSWDFGDNKRSKGEKVTHSFPEKGEYTVNLEVALRSDSTSYVKKTGISRKILIFNDAQEKNAYIANGNKEKKIFSDIRGNSNSQVETQYTAEFEFQSDAVFCIEVLSSKSKVDLNSSVFRNIPEIYPVKERIDQFTGSYSYTVDQYMNLMAAYPAYRKMISLGFKSAIVKMFVLTDPAEKELHNLIRINGPYADSYFDNADRFTSNAFIMLDQLVRLMNKYPTLRLEVAVHTDNTGTPENNQALSQKRAQMMIDYVANRGINARRLVAKGFGGSKPVASNFTEKDRRLNRRIDFTMIGR